MYKRIMVVVDNRPITKAALFEGSNMAKQFNAEIVLFSVVPLYDITFTSMAGYVDLPTNDFDKQARATAKTVLNEAARVLENDGLRTRIAMASGTVASEVIVEAALKNRCDMIIVATEGKNALLRLITGSVIPGLISASPVPVLVCKQKKLRQAAKQAVAKPIKPLSSKRATPLVVVASKKAKPVQAVVSKKRVAVAV
jgi:nucleotide-binding universal stress UspA family protein